MVLPMPPGPTIVTRRSRDNRETSVATASSRPIIRVTANGRLCGARRGAVVPARERRLLASYRGNEIVAPSWNGDDVAMAALAVAEGAAQALTWILSWLLQRRFAARLERSVLPCRRPRRHVPPGRPGCRRRGCRVAPACRLQAAGAALLRSLNGPNEIARPSMLRRHHNPLCALLKFDERNIASGHASCAENMAQENKKD